MIRLPKVNDLASLVRVLEQNPFGSLVLVLLVLGSALVVWAARQ
jgi:hypothetical protein